jgi:hypothetical protein
VIVHGTLAWALDEFLVIKVEDPHLPFLLASWREISYLDCFPPRDPHDPFMQERILELGFED